MHRDKVKLKLTRVKAAIEPNYHWEIYLILIFKDHSSSQLTSIHDLRQVRLILLSVYTKTTQSIYWRSGKIDEWR